MTAAREPDLLRHLNDLVHSSFEGAVDRDDRNALFEKAVELLDPVVRAVLDDLDGRYLDRTGEVTTRREHLDDGGREAHWELSWPRQRSATHRFGGPVLPVRVTAFFPRTVNHPHLRGTTAGDWPLQVLDEADAARQAPIVEALVEAEFHQRIFDGRWHIVPRAVREHGEPGS